MNLRFALALVAGSLVLVPVFLMVHPPFSEIARDLLIPKAKVDRKQFAALESKLSSRRRSTDIHFDELANAVQDKTSPPPIAGQTVATDEQTLQTPPFAHPYYWGGFVYTGL